MILSAIDGRAASRAARASAAVRLALPLRLEPLLLALQLQAFPLRDRVGLGLLGGLLFRLGLRLGGRRRRRSFGGLGRQHFLSGLAVDQAVVFGADLVGGDQHLPLLRGDRRRPATTAA